MSLRERARDKPGQEWLTMTSQERPAGRGQRKDDVLRELTYTHREFSGEEAVRFGFATHVSADPLADAMALARTIASKSPTAVRGAKMLSNRTPDMTVDEVLMAESVHVQSACIDQNAVVSGVTPAMCCR